MVGTKFSGGIEMRRKAHNGGKRRNLLESVKRMKVGGEKGNKAEKSEVRISCQRGV